MYVKSYERKLKNCFALKTTSTFVCLCLRPKSKVIEALRLLVLPQTVKVANFICAYLSSKDSFMLIFFFNLPGIGNALRIFRGRPLWRIRKDATKIKYMLLLKHLHFIYTLLKQ